MLPFLSYVCLDRVEAKAIVGEAGPFNNEQAKSSPIGGCKLNFLTNKNNSNQITIVTDNLWKKKKKFKHWKRPPLPKQFV